MDRGVSIWALESCLGSFIRWSIVSRRGVSLLFIRLDLFGSAQSYLNSTFGNNPEVNCSSSAKEAGLSHWLHAEMRTLVLYRKLTLTILARTLHR